MRVSAAAAAFSILVLTASPAASPARAAGIPAPVSVPAPLAAHHAEYQLTLSKDTDGDVVGASGTMAYDVIDSCDAWAVRQKLSMMVTNSDGQTIHMVSDYATWESKDGLKMRFHMRQMTDQAVTAQTDGEASLERRGGPGTVHYTLPHDTTLTLPADTLFPMAHTEAIITAAREGKKFITLPLFDGTDENGAEDTSIAILDWKTSAETKWAALAAMPNTRVRLAFFDRTPDTITPNYQVGMRYWENGVADDLQMDFGGFVVDGKMTQFALQPRKC